MLCKENLLLLLTCPEQATQRTELHGHTDTQAAMQKKLCFHLPVFFLSFVSTLGGAGQNRGSLPKQLPPPYNKGPEGMLCSGFCNKESGPPHVFSQ